MVSFFFILTFNWYKAFLFTAVHNRAHEGMVAACSKLRLCGVHER